MNIYANEYYKGWNQCYCFLQLKLFFSTAYMMLLNVSLLIWRAQWTCPPKYCEKSSALRVALIRISLRSGRFCTSSFRMIIRKSDCKSRSWISSRITWVVLDRHLDADHVPLYFHFNPMIGRWMVMDAMWFKFYFAHPSGKLTDVVSTLK